MAATSSAASATGGWDEVISTLLYQPACLPLASRNRTVCHCRICDHEDRGMMGVVEAT